MYTPLETKALSFGRFREMFPGDLRKAMDHAEVSDAELMEVEAKLAEMSKTPEERQAEALEAKLEQMLAERLGNTKTEDKGNTQTLPNGGNTGMGGNTAEVQGNTETEPKGNTEAEGPVSFRYEAINHPLNIEPASNGVGASRSDETEVPSENDLSALSEALTPIETAIQSVIALDAQLADQLDRIEARLDDIAAGVVKASAEASQAVRFVEQGIEERRFRKTDKRKAWTPERREKARQQALERWAKKKAAPEGA